MAELRCAGARPGARGLCGVVAQRADARRETTSSFCPFLPRRRGGGADSPSQVVVHEPPEARGPGSASALPFPGRATFPLRSPEGRLPSEPPPVPSVPAGRCEVYVETAAEGPPPGTSSGPASAGAQEAMLCTPNEEANVNALRGAGLGRGQAGAVGVGLASAGRRSLGGASQGDDGD